MLSVEGQVTTWRGVNDIEEIDSNQTLKARRWPKGFICMGKRRDILRRYNSRSSSKIDNSCDRRWKRQVAVSYLFLMSSWVFLRCTNVKLGSKRMFHEPYLHSGYVKGPGFADLPFLPKSCEGKRQKTWRAEQTNIPLYHSWPTNCQWAPATKCKQAIVRNPQIAIALYRCPEYRREYLRRWWW